MLHSLYLYSKITPIMQSINSFITYLADFPSILLGCALFVVLLYAMYLDHKLYRFTRGQTGASLEELMKACVDSVAKIEKRNELISKHALTLDERVSHAIRNAQTLRYKAFDANGSNQSFSIALLNEKGNGVIISSLHSRDRMSTFAKPITDYSSSYELTEEEVAVIHEAKEAHKSTEVED